MLDAAVVGLACASEAVAGGVVEAASLTTSAISVGFGIFAESRVFRERGLFSRRKNLLVRQEPLPEAPVALKLECLKKLELFQDVERLLR